MKKTVITDDLIVFSDGFVWKRLSRKVAEALWNSVISHELELYWVRTDDKDAIHEELHHDQYEDRLYYENGDVYVEPLNEIV